MDGEHSTHRERRSGSGKGRDREALDHVAARRDRRQLERRREDEHHAESEEAEHGCRGEVQAWATAETKSEMRRRAASSAQVLTPTPLGKLKQTYDAAGLLVSYSRRRSSTFIICPLTGHLASRRAAPNAQLAQKT